MVPVTVFCEDPQPLPVLSRCLSLLALWALISTVISIVSIITILLLLLFPDKQPLPGSWAAFAASCGAGSSRMDSAWHEQVHRRGRPRLVNLAPRCIARCGSRHFIFHLIQTRTLHVEVEPGRDRVSLFQRSILASKLLQTSTSICLDLPSLSFCPGLTGWRNDEGPTLDGTGARCPKSVRPHRLTVIGEELALVPLALFLRSYLPELVQKSR